MEPRYNKNFHCLSNIFTPMVFVCFLSDCAVELQTTRYCRLPCYYLTPHSVRQTMQFSEDIAAVQPNYCKITPGSASRRRWRPPSNRSRAAVSQMSLPAAGGQQAERKEFRGNKYLFLTEKFSNKHFEIRILVCFLFFFQWTFKSSIQVGK